VIKILIIMAGVYGMLLFEIDNCAKEHRKAEREREKIYSDLFAFVIK
jgi:hypothetical protein